MDGPDAPTAAAVVAYAKGLIAAAVKRRADAEAEAAARKTAIDELEQIGIEKRGCMLVVLLDGRDLPDLAAARELERIYRAVDPLASPRMRSRGRG